MAEGGPPDTKTQKELVGDAIKQTLRNGETWYLIDAKWFKQWKKYVGYDSWDSFNVGEETANPGPIDSSPLFINGKLKEHLMDELDYQLVPQETWDKLVSWYGLAEGQEAISRRIIEQGMFVKHCKVEVYYLELKICENSDLNKTVTKEFSRADTLEHLTNAIKEEFNISKDKEVRLWNKYMSNTFEELKNKENTLQDTGLYNGQLIVIEQQNDDGTWPREAKISTKSYTQSGAATPTFSSAKSYGSSSSSYGYDYNTGKGQGSKPGICGLSNLGNTCFMNSATQCMSNVPILTKYFLGNQWVNELNEDNPLGMKGEIAKSYAELIKQMWSGNHSYTVPRGFKVAVGHFAPQFSGFQQQDAQELMAFLLDGLHEDLNRIKKKPYIELNEANGRPDEQVAQEAWDVYRKRNDSIIVDTFHGQLKSTLICPDCSKVSVTFDPFCYLSLPLPYKKERQLEVFLVPMDPTKKPMQFKLTVPKNGTVGDLSKSLAKYTDIEPNKMIVTDVYNHRFHKMYATDDALNHILERDDIFIYEVAVNDVNDPSTLIVPVYLRVRKDKSGAGSSQYSTSHLFGQPLLIAVPRKQCTYADLYSAIVKRMGRYVQEPAEADEWWKEEQQECGEVEMHSESSDTEDMGENKEEDSSSVDSEDDSKKQAPRMFTFQLVNSYGSAEVQTILDDGKPIKLNNRSYIAVDWHVKAREKFYDEKAAEEFEVHPSVNQRLIPKKTAIQLHECLDLFTTIETLGEHDPWYCPECKKHQQATKKFDVWSLPNVLVIHLKRFSYNRYWRDKIDTLVEFPTTGLDLQQYIINKNHGPVLYDLIGVVNHYGGMGGGHYTAYCQSPLDQGWYYFDDSSVSSSNAESVCTKAAYVLVYQKRGLKSALYKELPDIKRDIPAAAGSANEAEDGTNQHNKFDHTEMELY